MTTRVDTLEPLPRARARAPAGAAQLSPSAWLRENLFGSPLDTVLTVVFAVLLAWVAYRVGTVRVRRRGAGRSRGRTHQPHGRPSFPRDQLSRPLGRPLRPGRGLRAAARGHAGPQRRREVARRWPRRWPCSHARDAAPPRPALRSSSRCSSWFARLPRAGAARSARSSAVGLRGQPARHADARQRSAALRPAARSSRRRAGRALSSDRCALRRRRLGRLGRPAPDDLRRGRRASLLSFPLGVLLALGRRSSFRPIRARLRRLHRADPRRAADHDALRRRSSCSASSCRSGVDSRASSRGTIIGFVSSRRRTGRDRPRRAPVRADASKLEAAQALGLAHLKTTA